MAPLSEAGDVTEKYYLIRDLLLKYQKNVQHFHGATLKEVPANMEKAANGTFPIKSYLLFEDMLNEDNVSSSLLSLLLLHVQFTVYNLLNS